VKLLFDQNLSFKLPKKLEEVFPGSSQVKLLNMEQADDPEIWEYAQRNGFTLVSRIRTTMIREHCGDIHPKSFGFDVETSERATSRN